LPPGLEQYVHLFQNDRIGRTLWKHPGDDGRRRDPASVVFVY